LKCLAVMNTIAYHGTGLITTLKSFRQHGQRFCTLKNLMVVINATVLQARVLITARQFEVSGSYEHSSLSRYGINYNLKKFFTT
jgi:hypothetical protein